MSKKKYLIGLLILFISFLGWYFFIKKSDYIITFKAKTSTTTIFQGVQEWAKMLQNNNQAKVSIIKKNNFDNFDFKTTKGNEIIDYSWEMKPINDSITEVWVGIKEENKSFINRIVLPFVSTKFKEEQINKIKDFKLELDQHLKQFKVKINGEGKSEKAFVAYIHLKSVLQEKAQNMMMNDSLITLYLSKNNIKIIGKPYVEIVNWDLDSENIDFNYCFPIDKNTKYIPDANVKFKTIPALKGLSATYYGNMRTSDRAWFALMDYAKTHNITLENKPLEHFFANPFNGGNELEWETKIIIPFKK